MQKFFIIPIVVIALCFITSVIITFAFNQDDKNKLARKSIELLDGNYLVTYSNGPTEKKWNIISGKVTTSDKGYYFFWDSKNHYVQVPVVNTVIEAN